MTALMLLIGIAIGAGAVWLWAHAKLAAAAETLLRADATQTQWEERLKAATGDALLESQASLLTLAETKLAPIKETLLKFEQQARALEDRRLQAVSAVGVQLKAVADGQERLRNETGSLVTALRAPHVRGSWGEVQLKRVVELAGLVEYCDFRTQANGPFRGGLAQ